jgi:hypothetical protein
MNDSDLRKCSEILEKLISRPCAADFLSPIDDTQPGMSDYYRRIRRPIDLNQIRTKLLLGECQTVADFRSDINLIRQNAHRYFGANSQMGALATALWKYFLRLMDTTFEKVVLQDWFDKVRESAQKLEKVFAKAPTTISRARETAFQVGPFPKIHKKMLNRLIETSLELRSKADAQAMFRIIQRFEPKTPIVSKNVTIDVDSLPVGAVWGLDRYIRNRFAELGKTFPEG